MCSNGRCRLVSTCTTANLGKLAKRDSCHPLYCSCAVIRGNVNWLLSAATAHEQRVDKADERTTCARYKNSRCCHDQFGAHSGSSQLSMGVSRSYSLHCSLIILATYRLDDEFEVCKEFRSPQKRMYRRPEGICRFSR